jgi:CheY-like chemotaxis protein
VKIVHIEDRRENRILVRKLLEAAGHEVIDAVDGVTGIDLATSVSPDLVLVDINLPGLDGYEVVTKLRGQPALSETPIVAVTAEGDRDRAVAELTQVMPAFDGDRFLCAFSHIFAGGYSAGYYSYKFAEVLSADAFAAFEEAGLDDADAVKEMGAKFRDTVLALGGSVAPAAVFERFRGRAPATEALLRHSGLVPSAAAA